MADDSEQPSARQLPADQRRALGARIAAGRRERGWNQRELSRRTGIRFMRLSKLENGHATPNVPELLLLSEALAVSLDELARGTPPPVEASPQRSLLLAHQDLEELMTAEEWAVFKRLLRVLVAGFTAIRPERRSTA